MKDNSNNELENAMKQIIARFKQQDPSWTCSIKDPLGLVSFLAGSRSHTMKEAIPDVQSQIEIIKAYAERELLAA